jgi:preprotein translocase SecE subunit
MADEKKILQSENEAEASVEVKKKEKVKVKKENFFVRFGKKFAKLCKDTVGELKKVSWLSKTELKKSTKLVIVTVVAFAVVILAIDSLSSFIINTVAGLLG